VKPKKSILFPVAVVGFLTACGGGGDTASPPSAVPVEAVVQKFVTTPATYSATSSSGYVLSVTVTRNADAPASGGQTPNQISTLSAIVRSNGVVQASGSTIVYFKTNPLSVVSYGGRLTTNNTPLPAMASDNASGPFFLAPTTNTYSPNGLTGTWSVSSGYACLTIQTGPGLSSMISFATTTVETYCLLPDGAGNITKFVADTATNARATMNNPQVDRMSYR
jgi:hypothetical protein